MLTFMPLAPGTHGDALVLLLAVLVADLFLGLVPGIARLVPDGTAIFTSVARALERRLNRVGRTRQNLLIRGAIVTLLLVALGAGTGIALFEASKAVPYGWAIDALVLLVCVSGRRVFFDLRRGLAFAASNDIDQGRARVGQGDIRSVFYLCAVGSLFNIMLVAALTLALVRL